MYISILRAKKIIAKFFVEIEQRNYILHKVTK